VPHVRVTGFVEAPFDQVWAAHVDGDRIPDWFPGVRAVEEISGSLDTPGTTYVLRFNRLLRSRVEVIEVQAPVMHTRRWDARPLGTYGTATLLLRRREGGGTHVDLDVTYGLPLGPLGRWLERLTIVRRRAARDIRRELQAFGAFARHHER
jgi:uncharacterized protein YndB with AHSA1/START domain